MFFMLPSNVPFHYKAIKWACMTCRRLIQSCTIRMGYFEQQLLATCTEYRGNEVPILAAWAALLTPVAGACRKASLLLRVH